MEIKLEIKGNTLYLATTQTEQIMERTINEFFSKYEKNLYENFIFSALMVKNDSKSFFYVIL